jgi:lactoylglutathione lyase
MIKRIDPIIYFVSNFDECLSFYRDKLGLKLSGGSPPHEGFATFKLENVEFSIHAGYKGSKDGPINIHFSTNDIHAEVARLKKAGVAFTKDVEKMTWGDYEASFLDPDGNELEIYESRRPGSR